MWGKSKTLPAGSTACALGLTAGRTCPPQNSSSLLLPPLASARTWHPLPARGCLSHPQPRWNGCRGRNFPRRPPWVCLHKDIRGGVCDYCPGALGRSHPRAYPSPWGAQTHTCSRREASLCSELSVPQPCPSPSTPFL